MTAPAPDIASLDIPWRRGHATWPGRPDGMPVAIGVPANDNSQPPRSQYFVYEEYSKGRLHRPDDICPEVANELNFASAILFHWAWDAAAPPSLHSSMPDRPRVQSTSTAAAWQYGGPRGAEAYVDYASRWTPIVYAAGPFLPAVYGAAVRNLPMRALAPEGTPVKKRAAAGRLELVLGLERVGDEISLMRLAVAA